MLTDVRTYLFYILMTFLLLSPHLIMNSYSQQEYSANESIQKGIEELNKKNYDKAIMFFENALNLNNTDIEAYHWLAQTYLVSGTPQKAIIQWKKVLSINPNDERAKKYLDKLLNTDIKPDVHIPFVISLIDEELYSDALEQIQKGIQDISDEIIKLEYLILEVRVLRLMKQNKTALVKAMDMSSKYKKSEKVKDILIEIARIYNNDLNTLDKSISIYNEILKDKNKDSSSALEDALLDLGAIYLYSSKRDDKKAEKYFKLFIEKYPNSKRCWEAYYNLFQVVIPKNITIRPTNSEAKLNELENNLLKLMTATLIRTKYINSSQKSHVINTFNSWINLYKSNGMYSIACFILDNFAFNTDIDYSISIAYAFQLIESYLEWGRTKLHSDLNKGYGMYKQLNKPFNTASKILLKLYNDERISSEYLLNCLLQMVDIYSSNKLWIVCEEVYSIINSNKELESLESLFYHKARYHLNKGSQFISIQKKIGSNYLLQFNDDYAKSIEYCLNLKNSSNYNNAVMNIINSILSVYQKERAYDLVEAFLKNVFDEYKKDSKDTILEYVSILNGYNQYCRAFNEFQFSQSRFKKPEDYTLNNSFRNLISYFRNHVQAYPDGEYNIQIVDYIKQIAESYKSILAFEPALDVYDAFIEDNNQWKYIDIANYERTNMFLTKAINSYINEKKNITFIVIEKFELSSDFTNTLKEISSFIKNFPDSIKILDAQKDIIKIALIYANDNNWNVAKSIFEKFLELNPKFNQKEWILYYQGMCEVGKLQPEYAISKLNTYNELFQKTDEALPNTSQKIEDRSEYPKAPVVSVINEKSPKDLNRMPNSLNNSLASPSDAPTAYDEDYNYEHSGNFKNDPSGQLGTVNDEIRSKIAIRDSEKRIAEESTKIAYQQNLTQKTEYESINEISQVEKEKINSAFSSAYKIFISILKEYPNSQLYYNVRSEIIGLISFLKTKVLWIEASEIYNSYIKDIPDDKEIIKLNLDYVDCFYNAALHVSIKKNEEKPTDKIKIAFDLARDKINSFLDKFKSEEEYKNQALLLFINSYWEEARLIVQYQKNEAKSKYLLAMEKIFEFADQYPKHSYSKGIISQLVSMADEVQNNQLWDVAIQIYSNLKHYYPFETHDYKLDLKKAGIYYSGLKDYLKAVESYQEYLFLSQSNDPSLLNQIIAIGNELRQQQRWIEALHVFSTFVDSFPKHEEADNALSYVGDIHVENNSWAEAINIYNKLLIEYPDSKLIKDVQHKIAECQINLSNWKIAIDIYEKYLKDYNPNDEAIIQKITILKDIYRFQQLIDNDKTNRKIDDAQYQIGMILKNQLNNKVKAIIEFTKVVENYPKSHQADDAQFAIGKLYLEMDKLKEARNAFTNLVKSYPESPMADDGLYWLGQSYENEAVKLTSITKEEAEQTGNRQAQSQAYEKLSRSIQNKKVEVQKRLDDYKRKGETSKIEAERASVALNNRYNLDDITNFAQEAQTSAVITSVLELANKQDKINSLLRKAIQVYNQAAQSYILGDYTDKCLLQMASIFENRLKNIDKAMETFQTIVKYFKGTTIAEDASWKIAEFYSKQEKHEASTEAYKEFIRNYPNSSRVAEAQFHLAESFERSGKWVEAMDAYTIYIDKFPDGLQVQKAKDQINWIKAYKL